MIVLDANILIRAILGRRVRELIDAWTDRGIRFFAPDVAFADAAKYLPPLLVRRGKATADIAEVFFRRQLKSVRRPFGSRFDKITALQLAKD